MYIDFGKDMLDTIYKSKITIIFYLYFKKSFKITYKSS